MKKLALSLVCLITLESGLFAEDKNKTNNGEYFANLGLEALEKQDNQKAKEYLQKAKKLLNDECMSGLANSCLNIGKLYLNDNISSEIYNNITNAFIYFKEGCGLGSKVSCLYFEQLINHPLLHKHYK